MLTKFLKILAVIVLAVGTALTLFPFFWAVMLSLKSNPEILSKTPSFFPKQVTFSGYKLVFLQTPIYRWFLNSAIVSISVVAAVLFTSSLAGYIFAKFEFKGKNAVFILLLATMMVPFQVTMIPVFIISSWLGMINTLYVLIVPSVVSAFGIFLCRQFIEDVPTAMMEAGRIEGVSEFAIYWNLILPQIKPGLAALGIFTFIGKWNDYMWPLVAINEFSKMTVPLALNTFNTQRFANLNAILSASVVVITPIIIVFLFFQRQFIEGVTLSGMK